MTAEEIAQLFCQDCTSLTYKTDYTNAWKWKLDSCGLDDPIEAWTLAELEPLAVAAAQAIANSLNSDRRR